MLNIKEILIATCVSLLVGLLFGAIPVWKYQANKYEKKIAEMQIVQKDALLQEQTKVIQKERQNNDLIAKLDEASIVAEQRRNNDATTIASLLRASAGRVHGATVCKANTGASSEASGPVANESSEGQLSAEFQEYLAKELQRCDEAADYANTGHEFAKAIEEQRKRLSNE